MKKGKVVLAQPAAVAPWMLSPRPPLSRAPAPVGRGREEAAYRAVLRYRGLIHDYQELVKETEAMKRRLHAMKIMKRRLLAEVKFLRKRYNSMSENPFQTTICRLRNPLMTPPISRTTAGADNVDHRSVPVVGSSSKSLPVQRRQLGPPRASPVIDLNETCEPSHEEMEMGEYHGYPLEGDFAAGPSGVRTPVFRDIQNSSVRDGKRKISYQDPLILGV